MPDISVYTQSKLGTGVFPQENSSSQPRRSLGLDKITGFNEIIFTLTIMKITANVQTYLKKDPTKQAAELPNNDKVGDRKR